jgi:hypothetical protein
VATRTFEIKRVVNSTTSWRTIVAGDARVGLEDFRPNNGATRLQGTEATFLALIDGSDNTVAVRSRSRPSTGGTHPNAARAPEKARADSTLPISGRISSSTPTRAAPTSSIRAGLFW